MTNLKQVNRYFLNFRLESSDSNAFSRKMDENDNVGSNTLRIKVRKSIDEDADGAVQDNTQETVSCV